MSDNRRNDSRYIYCYHLSMEHEGYIEKAAILDWSLHGLHLAIGIPAARKVPGRVSFFIERKVPPLQTWRREGDVRWVKFGKEGWEVGVRFHEPLDFIPFDRLELFLKEVSCDFSFIADALFPNTPKTAEDNPS